jgi:hypothetical protein
MVVHLVDLKVVQLVAGTVDMLDLSMVVMLVGMKVVQ